MAEPARSLAAWAEALAPHTVPGLATRRVDGEAFWQAVAGTLDRGPFDVDTIGHSVQGRPLRAVRYGTGETGVLLWSQMHGDEATATRALADLLALFAAGADPVCARLAERLTVTMVPILNPDGAMAHQRENADGVDLNRDATRAVSPEARALRDLRDRLAPGFGFNLHDQDVRRRAGPDGDQVAIALLAPAAEASRNWPEGRDRARRVAATMAAGLAPALPRRVARWTDDYDPRAFGEVMQAAGTATVLIEAGALPDDPEKEALRRHYGAVLLLALEALAEGSWAGADPAGYEDLPLNHGVDHDVHLTGGTVQVADRPLAADVALLFDDPVARQGARLAAVGDLGPLQALEEMDCTGHTVVLRPERERSPGVVAPEDRVTVEVRDGASGRVLRAF